MVRIVHLLSRHHFPSCINSLIQFPAKFTCPGQKPGEKKGTVIAVKAWKKRSRKWRLVTRELFRSGFFGERGHWRDRSLHELTPPRSVWSPAATTTSAVSVALFTRVSEDEPSYRFQPCFGCRNKPMICFVGTQGGPWKQRCCKIALLDGIVKWNIDRRVVNLLIGLPGENKRH